MAELLGRGKTTIGDEINRNGGRGAYDAKKADHRAYVRQWRKKRECNKVALSRELSHYVEKKLEMFWSPERIAGRLKEIDTHITYASAKSIRKYITKRPSLERFLFWNHVHKKSGKKYRKGETLTDRRFITERPLLFGSGHWEGDFIVSTHSTHVLLVLVETESFTTLIRLLPNRNNNLVNQAVVSMLRGYEVKTLTLDNDIAFGKHKELEEMLCAPLYFTRPYTSTDKALVENTNRWIRAFVPKKTDLRTLSHQQIDTIQHWFNHTPRQCLSFRTPFEVMLSSRLSLPVSVLDGR